MLQEIQNYIIERRPKTNISFYKKLSSLFQRIY